jgi:hypothetical protein
MEIEYFKCRTKSSFKELKVSVLSKEAECKLAIEENFGTLIIKLQKEKIYFDEVEQKEEISQYQVKYLFNSLTFLAFEFDK